MGEICPSYHLAQAARASGAGPGDPGKVAPRMLPLLQPLSSLSDEERVVLRCKFDIAYVLAREKLFLQNILS